MVDFLNDAYAGTPTTDRNLYVASASVDNATIAGSMTEMAAGAQHFTFGAAPAIGFIGPATALLTLHLAEDAWQSDAAYTVTVDGKAVASGTATALNALGQSQSAGVSTPLSAGFHDLAISFLNDAYGGTPATDRNLYVQGVDVNGVAQPGSAAALLSTGTSHVQLFVPSR